MHRKLTIARIFKWLIRLDSTVRLTVFSSHYNFSKDVPTPYAGRAGAATGESLCACVWWDRQTNERTDEQTSVRCFTLYAVEAAERNINRFQKD